MSFSAIHFWEQEQIFAPQMQFVWFKKYKPKGAPYCIPLNRNSDIIVIAEILWKDTDSTNGSAIEE